MRKTILAAMALLLMSSSLSGCYWGYYGHRDRGYHSGHHDDRGHERDRERRHRD